MISSSTDYLRTRSKERSDVPSNPISRLLLVSGEFPPIGGGVSRLAESLASNFDSLGIEVGVVGPKVSADYAAGRRYPFWGFRNRFLDMPFVLARATKSFKPDVCLFTTWWPGAFWHSRFLPATPFAVIYCGAELLNCKTSLKKRLRSFITNRAIEPVLSNGICHLAISDYTRGLLVRRCPKAIQDRLKTIPCGVSSDWPAAQRPADAPSQPYVLFVGRLEKTKGVRTLIDAFEIFAEKNESHNLILVGKGPLTAEILDRIGNTPLSRRVRLLQNLTLSELGWVYKHCEFLVLPSEMDTSVPKVEGFGLVVLEAALWKKPSIGTRSGGIPSALVDGVTGVLVPECDPAELSVAMETLSSEGKLRNQLGTSAYTRAVEEHDWSLVASRYLQTIGSHIQHGDSR